MAFFSISLPLSKWENIPHKGCRKKGSDCCVVRACLFREILALNVSAAECSTCLCLSVHFINCDRRSRRREIGTPASYSGVLDTYLGTEADRLG
jgi:hypothetical protein